MRCRHSAQERGDCRQAGKMKLIQIKPEAALFGILLGLNDQPCYLAPSFFIGGENACGCYAVRFASKTR
jgi:hypothetical protein